MTEHGQPVSPLANRQEPDIIAEPMTDELARTAAHQRDPHGIIAILLMGMLIILLALLVLAIVQAA